MNAHPSRSHADKPASATHPAEGRATGSACGVELLAPAGSMAALHAAVSAGADAVYLGMESFNARRGADNFTAEMLMAALRENNIPAVKRDLGAAGLLNLYQGNSFEGEQIFVAPEAFERAKELLLVMGFAQAEE